MSQSLKTQEKRLKNTIAIYDTYCKNEYLDLVKQAINELDLIDLGLDAIYLKNPNDINIFGIREIEPYGAFEPKTGIIYITQKAINEGLDRIKIVFLHEYAHLEYTKLDTDKKNEWMESILKISPITEYASSFYYAVKNFEGELKKSRDQVEKIDDEYLRGGKYEKDDTERSNLIEKILFSEYDEEITRAQAEVRDNKHKLEKWNALYGNETYAEYKTGLKYPGVVNDSFNEISKVHDRIFEGQEVGV